MTLTDVTATYDNTVVLYLFNDLSINLCGTNKLITTTDDDCIAAGNLKIYGNGSLDASTEGDTASAISALGNIEISGGTINASAKGRYGIYSGSDTIKITGGSVTAQGQNGAFSNQPEFGSNWYKWRTSRTGDYTDSRTASYLWHNTDTYVEIRPLDESEPATVCNHEYEWVEDVAATADSDAKLVYKCRKCGDISMRMTEANSAFGKSQREYADKITKAAANSTVRIEARNWTSFQRTVMDALAKRPDVTLVIEYTDAGNRRQITIPAGTDLTGFVDDNGYTGFSFLISKGLETDYWKSRQKENK